MTAPVLMVENLSKQFPGGEGTITVLDNVCFTIHAGETVAIVGPSGSGKSTLLGLVAGLDAPSGGRIVVEGRDLAEFRASDLAVFRGARMGFVFQSYRLLPMLSAEENVRVPLELAGVADAGDRARTWLKRVGLGSRGSHLPAKLSGGEQQRVALARALAPEPALVFADEPTGNLDSHTGSEMADLLFSLTSGGDGVQPATLVVVTHDQRLAERAGRVIELEDGRVRSDSKRARAL